MSQRKLFVGGLRQGNLQKEDLERLFSPFGEITYVQMKTDFGFVEFASEQSAQDAISKIDQTEYMGNRVSVSISQSKRDAIRQAGGTYPPAPTSQVGYRDRSPPPTQRRYDDQRYPEPARGGGYPSEPQRGASYGQPQYDDRGYSRSGGAPVPQRGGYGDRGDSYGRDPYSRAPPPAPYERQPYGRPADPYGSRPPPPADPYAQRSPYGRGPPPQAAYDGGYGRDPYRSGGPPQQRYQEQSRGGDRYQQQENRPSRFGKSHSTVHRLKVRNFTVGSTWQDLKDFFRREGLNPTYTVMYADGNGEGEAHLASEGDLNIAMDKLNGTMVDGNKIELVRDDPSYGGGAGPADYTAPVPQAERGRSASPEAKANKFGW